MSFDGVFALAGYDYDLHTRHVVGGVKTYPIEEFMKLSKELISLNSGREILQVFLQSMDGGYVEPIGHIVMPYGKSSLCLIF